MNDVRIELIKNKFAVETPPHMAGLCRAIPNRRWNGKTRVWMAANIRGNRQYLMDTFDRENFTNEAWAAVSIKKKKNTGAEFPIHYQFKVEPFKHQRKALNKMTGLDAYALFMEQGLGKTFTTINDLSRRFVEDQINAVLVVCPMSIRGVWQREMESYATVPVKTLPLVTKSANRDLEELWEFEGLKCYVVAVESLSSGKAHEIAEKFILTTRAAMIIDESSTIKNFKASRTKRCIKIGKNAKVRGILTGTPIAGGYHDLFSQFEFIDSEIIGMGDFYSFRNRYCIMGGFEDRKIIGYDHIEELMELVSENIFQATKADSLDLPDKIYQTREIEPTVEQKRLFKAIKQKLVPDINGDRVKIDGILEKLLRLRQLTAGFYTTDEGELKVLDGVPPKIKELISMIGEVNGKVILWATYRKEISMISEALKKLDIGIVEEIHGGVDEVERNGVMERFQNGETRFIVANPTTAGMGLTLTAANTNIYMSNSFSYIDRAQSEDRSHRISQDKHVVYIDMMVKGSVDELAYSAIKNKQNMADFVKENIKKLLE
jgi:SNF2 family DNA or RNA helicase